MSSSNWVKVLADNFGHARLSADAAERWARDLEDKYRGITDEELCQAIVWGSDDRNYKLKSAYPDLRDIRRWLAMLRKSARTAAETPDGAASGPCNGSGWVTYWPGLVPEDAATLDDFERYRCAIPCACSAGRSVYARVYGDGQVNEGDQIVVARTAVRQNARRNEIAANGRGSNP
jgi:hypothetical protein